MPDENTPEATKGVCPKCRAACRNPNKAGWTVWACGTERVNDGWVGSGTLCQSDKCRIAELKAALRRAQDEIERRDAADKKRAEWWKDLQATVRRCLFGCHGG